MQSKASDSSQMTYQFVNMETDKYMAVENINDSFGLAVQFSEGRSKVQDGQMQTRSKSEWLLVEANTFENRGIETAGFKLQEDIRDNNWFKLAIPQPDDIPGVGATATAKIDAIGKMIGIFPDQNELEELYNALVEAMKQIIEQALKKNELHNVMGDWNSVHINLNVYKGTKDPEKMLEALEDAAKIYADITGRLMVDDVKEAGLVLFMQAASEHLANIWSIEMLSPGRTGQGYMATAQTYADHLRNTFKEMLEKRLALITIRPYSKLSPIPFGYEDHYQRWRIVGSIENLYDTIDEYRHIMASHFAVEFGDPLSLAQTWMEQPLPGVQAQL